MNIKKNDSPLRIVSLSCREVLWRRSYALMALGAALFFLVVSIWLAMGKFTIEVITSDFYSFGTKAAILLTSLAGFQTNFSLESKVATLVISAMVGINIALLVYHTKRTFALQKEIGTSALGMAAGFFGVGCASCGSAFLASFIGLSAATGFVGILPFKGLEFNLLSIIIISISIYVVARNIQRPPACRVKVKNE